VLAGVLPAVAAGRVRPLPMLQPPAVRRLPVGRFLVGAEIAVSIVLLVPALLFVRAAIRVSAVDPGFDAANTVAVNVRRGGAPLPAAAAQARYGSLLHTLQTTAGVQRVASVGFLPLSFFEWSPDLRNSADGSRLRASAQSVGAGYFSAMGIRVSGREFEPADCARSETLAIVNETFARRYFPGDSPLTKTVGLVSGPANRRTEQRLEIVGVVGDSKYMTLGEGPRPVLYRPHCTAGDAVTFVVRSGEQSRNLITIVRRRLTEIDATSTVDVVPLAEHVGAAAWPGRAAAGLLTALAIVGLTLAMAGAYGALSFSVARRTSELAIRMSIGGTRGSVMRMVVLDGLRTVAVGTALGLAGAAALMSPLRDLLPHGLTATDPVTYCSVAGIMLAVGLAASAIPSYRAMNTNVVQALRAE